MSRIRTVIVMSTVALISVFATTQARAVPRTHVSAAVGADTNVAAGCTPVAPCRTFKAAMAKTDPNGEVVVLDSGGYDAVTIAQSVALIAPTGVYAGISVPAKANGVTIATSGLNVVLRGIAINGQGGNNGIVMTADSKLTIENCVVANLGLHGIFVSGLATVRITDTIVRDSGSEGVWIENGARGTITRATISGNAASGIYMQGHLGNTVTKVDIANSTFDGNAIGVVAFSDNASAVVNVSLRDSRVVRNQSVGLHSQSNAGATVSVSASSNIVSNNVTGMLALGAGVKLWASGNTVSDNLNTGLVNAGGVFESAGDNAVRNNGLNKNGPISVIPTE